MNTKFACTALAFGICALASTQAHALLPPWWLTYYGLCHSVALTTGVSITQPIEVGEYYVIQVVVQTQWVGTDVLRALDALLVEEPNPYTRIEVVDAALRPPRNPIDPNAPQTAQSVKTLISTAFRLNPYFAGTTVEGPNAYLDTQPVVVQYFTDDISEARSRSSFTAEALFDEALVDELGGVTVGASTRGIQSWACSGAT